MSNWNRLTAILAYSATTELLQTPAQKELANGVICLDSPELNHSEFARSKSESTETQASDINAVIRPAFMPFLHDISPVRLPQTLPVKELANGVLSPIWKQYTLQNAIQPFPQPGTCPSHGLGEFLIHEQPAKH